MRRLRIAVLSLLVVFAVCPMRASVCNTAQGASSGGLRVDHYITDAPQHRRWSVVVDCSHPERPWTLQAVPWQSGARSAAVREAQAIEPQKSLPLIPAGMKVRLWRTAEGTKIELSGTALDAGAEGQTIHVRTGRHGAVLAGRVRGAGSVELLASTKWQDKSREGWSVQ